MKRSTLRHIIGAVLLGAAPLLAANVARAAETAETEMVIPATAEGIWLAIDGHVQDLREMINKDQLEDIHLHAYAVRDLVRELPGRSPGLSAAERAKISGQSKFVDTLAERLDEAGDANNEAAAISNLSKLEKVLKMIRAHYPPEQ